MTQTLVREDGRTPSDLRPISISFPRLARVDGSARFALGSTAALASFTGPAPAPPASEHPAHATLEVLVRPLSNVPGPTARTQASSVRTALSSTLVLTRNPRTSVGVVVQSLDRSASKGKGKGREDVLINAAACAALCAAAVPMRGVLVALCAARLPDGTTVLDPSGDEDARAVAGGCFAFIVAGSKKKLVWVRWWGGEDGLEEARTLVKEKVGDVVEAVRGAIAEAFGYELGGVEGEDDEAKMEI